MSGNEPGRIEVDKLGNVRVITIAYPSRLNAITPQMHAELLRTWTELSGDEEARAIVLVGRGEAFSAGVDIDNMVASIGSEAHRRRAINEARALVIAMTTCPIPTIAAVNGPAVGVGCTLALLCDLVVMADTAYFADPHVSVGLVAGDGGALIWPLLIGLSRAKRFLFTGDRVTAAEAVEWGLAVSSHPGEQLMEATMDLANRVAKQPYYALRATKAALNIHLQRAVSAGLEAGVASELGSLSSSEFHEQVDQLVTAREQRRKQRADDAGRSSSGDGASRD
jgi:enoyl-CoA hydratase